MEKTNPMSKRLRGLAIAAAVTVAAPAAQAFPDAKVETQLRPCFGLLTDPAVAKRCQGKKRHHDRDYGAYNTVYCDRARPGDVSRKLAALKPGATLHLVARTRACEDSLDIGKSVTIVADYAAGLRVPTLKALPGRPCVTVRPGVREVTLRGLTLEAEHAGAVACVVANGDELRLEDTFVRYDGDASGVIVQGGRLVMDRGGVAARTREAAVAVDGVIEARGARVFATRYGMRAALRGDSRLESVAISRLDDWTGSERVRSSGGLVVKGSGGRLMQVHGSTVDGFSRGVMLAGTDEVMFERSSILNADWAVTSDGGRLRLVGSELQAVEVGVFVGAGEAWVADNTFYGVRRAGMYAETGAQVRARDNAVYAHADGCQRLDMGAFDRSTLHCRPWYEAPEIWRDRRDAGRIRYSEAWADTTPAWRVGRWTAGGGAR